ncbi:MFS transporter, partial [Bacillus cereus]
MAGLVMGVAAAVYATLADSISIRNLVTFGIILLSGGSLLGYILHDHYWLVVLSRMIQAAGYGATETLYLVFIVKYVRGEEHKKYLGFNTSAFQI